MSNPTGDALAAFQNTSLASELALKEKLWTKLREIAGLSDRNATAAHRFLGKALKTMRHRPPSSITTDQLGSYPKTIGRVQQKGKLSGSARHRTCKYLNNIIEADRGALKRIVRPTRGFQTMRTAATTIKDLKVMRMLRRGRCLHLQAPGEERDTPGSQAN